MSAPFNLIWSQNGSIIRGYQNGAYVDGSLVFPVTFPGKTSEVQTITLQSSAQVNGTYDILANVAFYLTGDPTDLATVQGSWPSLGNTFNPPRAEMNGGLQISFDGSTWITFAVANGGIVGVGDPANPATWLMLPAAAIGPNGTDGTLGPYDVATIYMRYLIPPSATTYKVFDVQLAVSSDIV